MEKHQTVSFTKEELPYLAILACNCSCHKDGQHHCNSDCCKHPGIMYGEIPHETIEKIQKSEYAGLLQSDEQSQKDYPGKSSFITWNKHNCFSQKEAFPIMPCIKVD